MNIDKIRIETKGCLNKIYLNSAGSSLPPEIVVKKMIDYIELEELMGGYEIAKEKSIEINEFYIEISKLINCTPDNIAFTYNATDAYSRALSSFPFILGDYILTTNDDYISNYIAFISLQKRFGVKILRSKNLENGDIDFDDFEQLIIDYNPKLVSLTHIPTNSGLIQNAELVGEICKKYSIWYLLDACQSIGQIDVNVQKIGCDFMSCTGRKFLRGPRGSGFLYVSKRVINKKLEPLFIDMRGAKWTQIDQYEIQMNAKRFETWEFSYSSLIGLTEAVRYANNIGIANIQKYNLILSTRLRKGLNSIQNYQVLDKGSKISSIVTFHVAGIDLNLIEKILKNYNITYSVSLKEYAIIDFSNKNVDWAIRLSPHYFNTIEEIDEVVKILSNSNQIFNYM